MTSTDTVFSPRIYYLNPLLAGPLGGWGPLLDHVAALGFDHLLIAPPFAPGHAGNLLLSADFRRVHPALQAGGEGAGEVEMALGALVAQCRMRGLNLLLDLMLDRMAEDAALVREHPAWFEAADAPRMRDPRHFEPGFGGVSTRLGDPAVIAELAGWWGAQVTRWDAAGVAGYRLVGLAQTSPAAIGVLCAALRAAAPQARLLGWMPGVPITAHAALAAAMPPGRGFDAVFSSLPWWDFRAEWLFTEAHSLRSLAPVIGAPEAPFGPRLAGGGDAFYHRALGFAAGAEAGWMLPMGCEFAARAPLDALADSPDRYAEWRETAPFDLTPTITALNAARAKAPPIAGAPLWLGGTGAPVLAELSGDTPDLRLARRARLLLLNRDLTEAHNVSPAALLSTAGAAFPALAASPPLTLAPGECRLLQADAAAPIRPTKEALPLDDARAAAAAPRLAIEAVEPRIVDQDAAGRPFAVKRIVGESVRVTADVLCDGHDQLRVVLLWRELGAASWQEAPMRPLSNDRYEGEFPLHRVGRHEFTVEAWHDAFATFRDELIKKRAADVPITLELEEGRLLVERAMKPQGAPPALRALAKRLRAADDARRLDILLADDTARLMQAADPRARAARLQPLPVDAERGAAAFSSWYEVFPRSLSDDAARHGTFDDVIRHLPRIRAMGFDVLYFPPIHPIGRINRKGRNNARTAEPGDPGSPYAIGSGEGGHDAIHPELGTIEDFRRLREQAHAHGLELALDFAVQCAPDHPWLAEHRAWFAWRPDGSMRYAENPPKKYEDIVNVDFYADAAIPDLWLALRDIVLYWVGEGIRIFRVDNPHTKPFAFWQWMIADVRAREPTVFFLAEAFTRPKVMYRLAKLGFSQSYTYFTWRNTKIELQDYLTEISNSPVSDFFRPNFFVNTPDINPPFLQTSGRSGFLIRAALAATLSGAWGVYNGFELCESAALPGREEYLDSEKYQLRQWDWEKPGNIVAEITQLNAIRRRNPALHTQGGLRFLSADNQSILYFCKATADRSNILLIAISLDPFNAQEADITLPMWQFDLPDTAAIGVHDLVQDLSFTWQGISQHIRLTPERVPYAIWRLSI